MGFGRERKGNKQNPHSQTTSHDCDLQEKKLTNPYLDHTLLNAKKPQNPGISYMVKRMNKSPYILKQASKQHI